VNRFTVTLCDDRLANIQTLVGRFIMLVILISDMVKRCRRCCGPAHTGFSFTQVMRRSLLTFTSSVMRTAPNFGSVLFAFEAAGASSLSRYAGFNVWLSNIEKPY
jgi:hypothetical protein